MAQLAALGVVVPEDFRKENVMVGDWQTAAQKVTRDTKSEIKAEQELGVRLGLNDGVHKRKVEEKEEEEETVKLEEGIRRPRYGRDLRALPEDDDDLDLLLGSTTRVLKKLKTDSMAKETTATLADITGEPQQGQSREGNGGIVLVKQEATDVPNLMLIKTENVSPGADDVGSIFKKRKRPAKVK